MLDMEGRESPFQNLTKHIGMDIHAPTCPFSLGPSVHGPQVKNSCSILNWVPQRV